MSSISRLLLYKNCSTEADLLARMECKFAPRTKPSETTFQGFKGTPCIDSISGGGRNGRVTSILQFKGKHQGSTGDLAIALFVLEEAKEDGQIPFDIYREQITKRGGRFSNNSRKYAFIASVKRNEHFIIEAETGFRDKPVNQHYANVKVKDKWHYFNVPEPAKGSETDIPYGAYSLSKGMAKIFVSETEFSMKEWD